MELDAHQQFRIKLAPSLTLEAVIVTDKDSLLQSTSPQRQSTTLPLEQMAHLPGMGGEVDILQSLQHLPGIQPGTDDIGGLHVRGGNADQNLILFDGVPVYNPYHTLGLYSIFDFDMIRKVRYFRGQFPARFGGRVSSVVDVRTKQGNNKEFHGKASIGLIASKLALEGPLVKDKGAFYLSARRSHLDPVLKKYTRKQREERGEDGFLNYHFGEIIAKLDYRLNDKNHLYLSFYKGGDHYDNQNDYQENFDALQRTFKEQQQLNWGNTLSVLRWNHPFSNKLFANFTATYSTFQFQSDDSIEDLIFNEIAETDSFVLRSVYQSTIEDLSFKVDFDFVPNPQHYIRFGAIATNHRFQPGAISAQDDLFQDFPFLPNGRVNTPIIKAQELNAYFEDEWNLHQKLQIHLGAHASLFSVQSKQYAFIEPRLSLHGQIAPPLHFHLSFSQMNQYLHLLTRSGAGFPTDLWVPSTAKVKPQQSLIADAHLDLQLAPQWSMEGGVYYKKMKRLINYSEGANFLLNSDVLSTANWEDRIVTGQGQSYGLEALVKKGKGKWQGWLSYTWSKTNRQFDDLNNGQSFPFRFDLRHVLSLVTTYRWSSNWQGSASWSYRSGSQVNLALNEWQYVDQDGNPFFYFNDFGSKNSYTLPAYHRLDANVQYQKEKPWGSWSLHWGIYNAYNQRNIFYIKTEYNPLTRQLGYKSVSLIPILPYFRLSIAL